MQQVQLIRGCFRGDGVQPVHPHDIVDEALHAVVLVVREDFQTLAEFRRRLFHAADVASNSL